MYGNTSKMPRSASFDVLGTCFHFGPLIQLIDAVLRRQPNHTIDATTLFHSWFYAAQRDFTYEPNVMSAAVRSG